MAATVHVPRDHCLAPERVDGPIGEGGRYGRMFDLPALEADEKLLLELGAAGGFCDGGDKGDDGIVSQATPDQIAFGAADKVVVSLATVN